MSQLHGNHHAVRHACTADIIGELLVQLVDPQQDRADGEHAGRVGRREQVEGQGVERGEGETGDRDSLLAEPLGKRGREHDHGDGRGCADHVDDAVEYIGDVGTGELGAVPVDNVTQPVEQAAGFDEVSGGQPDFFEQILLGRRLLPTDRLNALICGEEGCHEQDQSKHGPDGHRHPPAVLQVVTDGEFGDQRQGEAADNKMGHKFPHDIASVDLFLDQFDGPFAGVRQNHKKGGAVAVEILARQLQHNIFGVPEIPTSPFVEGTWYDGKSCPTMRKLPKGGDSSKVFSAILRPQTVKNWSRLSDLNRRPTHYE